MPLNLSDEDKAEYERRCLFNQSVKEAAIAKGDLIAAKKARQANSRLYEEFRLKELKETVEYDSGMYRVENGDFQRTRLIIKDE